MKLLICIDNKAHAQATAQFGGQLAAAVADSVTLLHVTPTTEEKSAAAARLAELRPLIPLPEVQFKVRHGNAVQQIFDECQAGSYEMIVVGAPVVTGVLGGIFPSVAQMVAENAPVSVIVARESLQQLRRILICSSGTPINRPVVRAASQLAAACSAETVLLHVAEPVPQMYQGLQTMAETAAELLASDTPIAHELQWAIDTICNHGPQPHILLRHGLVSEEIIAETHAHHYDLVALGAPQKLGLWQSLFMSKAAPDVIEKAACSVMVVHASNQTL